MIANDNRLQASGSHEDIAADTLDVASYQHQAEELRSGWEQRAEQDEG